MTDLFATRSSNGSGHPPNGKVLGGITLREFAAAKKLPIARLRELGWRDDRHHGRSCIEIAYPMIGGGHGRTQVRVALTGPKRFVWATGRAPIVAYTPDRCALARHERYVVVVEGPSDAVTLLSAGIPAIAVPSAEMTGKLGSEHLTGLASVFLAPDADPAGAKCAEKVQARLGQLGFAGPVHVLKLPSGTKDVSELLVRDPAGFEATFRGLMREASEKSAPPLHPIASVWRTLGEWGALVREPAPRKWLLTRPDDETDGATRAGVLQLSKVGLLIAAGGAGKTIALVALALAVATGRKWLDYFGVATPGPVLVALSEEDAEEIGRRFHAIARAMRLTPEQEERAATDITVLPLAGMPVALVESDGRNTVETATLTELRQRLGAREWRLIILDPLSRFAGADTEKDNAAATRFVQALESLTTVPGAPAVLVAHHTNKLARANGTKAAASNSRGSSAITDGARWVAELESFGDEGARLTITKSNYGRLGAPIDLVRDAERGGYLRIVRPDEARQRTEAAAAARAHASDARLSELADRIASWLTTHPDQSKLAITEELRVRARDTRQAVDLLVAQGRVIQSSRYGYSITPAQGVLS